MKLLLKVMYDGTNYCGFQSQKNGRSVQEVLTSAVSALFGPCTVTGCSRTDAGVHALGFCAAVAPVSGTWESPPIPPEKTARALDRYLPRDIAVRNTAVVADNFHPRYDTTGKEYIYRMTDTPYRNPFSEGRLWHLRHPVTPAALQHMNEAAAHLVGTHDFTSFMAAGSKITDATRTISRCTVSRDPDGALTLRVAADGFLYNMVRIITGTLIDVAYGTIDPADMPNILDAKNRAAAGKTAPPHGLYLNEVTYRTPVTWC